MRLNLIIIVLFSIIMQSCNKDRIMMEYKISSLEKSVLRDKNNKVQIEELAKLYEAYLKEYPKSTVAFDYLFNLGKIRLMSDKTNQEVMEDNNVDIKESSEQEERVAVEEEADNAEGSVEAVGNNNNLGSIEEQISSSYTKISSNACFRIQLAMFYKPEQEQLDYIKDLSNKLPDLKIEYSEVSKNKYKFFTGEFNDSASANSLIKKITKAGFQCFLVKI